MTSWLTRIEQAWRTLHHPRVEVVALAYPVQHHNSHEVPALARLARELENQGFVKWLEEPPRERPQVQYPSGR